MMTSETPRALDEINVSRETDACLNAYAALVRKWSRSINLVSKNDLEHVRERHIEDSLQLASFLPKSPANWLDIGSGGGFPGIVMAIVAREQAPQTRFELVESDARKTAFLRTVIRELELNATVSCERIEAMTPRAADIMSARALAPLDMLLTYADRHLAPGGTCLFLKGKTVETEIHAAREKWSFDLSSYVSRTDASARLLSITGIHHV
jgi:16S rRNA (guanine527-N7)-methyltransferase